jgi:hypothetical protein
MFRTLGLHHLCVINRLHQIVGIVTREDLVVTHRLHSETSYRRPQQFDHQQGNSEQRTPHFSPEHRDHLRNRSKKSSSVLSPLYPPLSPSISPTSPLNGFLDYSPDGEVVPGFEGNGELELALDNANGHLDSENGNSFGRNRRQSLNHTIDLRASV